VHPATVQNRLDQHGLPRPRAPRRPRRAIQRQRACWAGKRQAHLAGLGFADVEGYLRVRRVGQGWSLRRMLAELQVGSAWLKDQMDQLEIPDQAGRWPSPIGPPRDVTSGCDRRHAVAVMGGTLPLRPTVLRQ
jgi:hypothetical protein